MVAVFNVGKLLNFPKFLSFCVENVDGNESLFNYSSGLCEVCVQCLLLTVNVKIPGYHLSVIFATASPPTTNLLSPLRDLTYPSVPIAAVGT